MKSILWTLKELNVPDVPSFSQLRGTQKALTRQINISPDSHKSAMGNIFHQNSLKDLLALVSEMSDFLRSKNINVAAHRIGPIHRFRST